MPWLSRRRFWEKPKVIARLTFAREATKKTKRKVKEQKKKRNEEIRASVTHDDSINDIKKPT
jgi:hypothetical protein